MLRKRHCDLCEYQVLSLEKGILCSKTKTKPDFNKTCLKIDFKSKLTDRLEELLVYLELNKNKRRQITSKIFFNSSFGLLVMIGSYFFIHHVFNKHSGYYTYKMLPIIGVIITSGFYLFKNPLVELASYNKEIKKLYRKLSDIEEVLNLYNVSYKYKIKISKEIHGTQEYSFDIDLINK